MALRAASVLQWLLLSVVVSPCAVSPCVAADRQAVEARRCANLLAIFDQIVVNRIDYRTLQVPDYKFDEARELRRQAEVDCAAGKLWFGVREIEDALLKIGYLPPGMEDGRFDY